MKLTSRITQISREYQHKETKLKHSKEKKARTSYMSIEITPNLPEILSTLHQNSVELFTGDLIIGHCCGRGRSVVEEGGKKL